MSLHEVVLCASGESESGNGAHGAGCITLHDIVTGSPLASFKQSSPGVHCTAAVETRGALGGLLLAAQPDKPILNVYSFQKDQLHLRVILPEKLSCVALDHQGTYCAGGTHAGRIYLWEIASGILFNSVEAHYRRINVLRFTRDGVSLISASEDSGVSVWSISRLLDIDTQHEAPTPICTFTDHTLPVTDVICGSLSSTRILTASMDNSCKLWDLTTRMLLTTFLFPHPITVLALDPSERVFFAASKDGSIHQVNLFRRRKDKLGHRLVGGMEAVGGAGAGDAERIEKEEEAEKERLISVGQPVTSLAISLTSSTLIVGTSTGQVNLYDIASHQLLRTFIQPQQSGLAITHVGSMLKPADLIGHIRLNDSPAAGGDKDSAPPIRPITAFQRVRDMKVHANHEVTMMLPIQYSNGDDKNHFGIPPVPTPESIAADHRYFVQPPMSSTSSAAGTNGSANISASAPALQSRVAELEAEVAQLRSQLGEAKGINDAMWDAVVNKVMSQPQVQPPPAAGPPSEAAREDEEMANVSGGALRTGAEGEAEEAGGLQGGGDEDQGRKARKKSKKVTIVTRS
ncbi:hypothetical protein BOTBODRAFT_63086 [Botryobasidium botryosum FD-172 SS1]|uniref:Pre-rRNA-processing protein IPI3 n=1 Tax=Botryobasidium botryosum (strain FD-172 SS1) TaxID=930990 RepID=A0A067MTL8_BOTB1|nr:hypothetical protein BOTBODRAFT_63086 [Botryobasidium botryosum FD-172 SS1]